MRIFIAIEFDGVIKDNLFKSLTKIKANATYGNYTLKENIHLTLRFLGEFKGFENIKSALTNTTNTISSFVITINGLGIFNNNILWAGIEKSAELFELYNILENELEKIGIEKEKRKFSPHITLSREIKLNKPIQDFSISPMQTTVKSITLMESKCVNNKLTYVPLFKCSLKQS